MKNNYISYSEMLIKFIEPLLDGYEDEDEFLEKAKMGMIAWNFHVSGQNKLPYDDSIKAILREVTKENSEARDILNNLVLRKEQLFSEYNQFLIRVEIRTKPDNSTTLFVESCPVEKILNGL